MSYKKFLVAFLIAGSTSVVFGQNAALKNQKMALHNYMFALADDYQFYLEDLAQTDDVMALTEPDSVSIMFKHKTYEIIEKELESYLGSNILPVNALEGKVLYDIEDYPSGTKKKAASSNVAPYYFKVGVQVTARDMIDDQLTVNNVAVQQRKIKPHVQIKLAIIDKDGKQVQKVKAKVKGDNWVTLDRMTLGGLISLEGKVVEEQQETLMDVIQRAVEELKSKL